MKRGQILSYYLVASVAKQSIKSALMLLYAQDDGLMIRLNGIIQTSLSQ